MKQNSLSKTYFLYFIILLFLVVFRILSALGILNIFGDSSDYVFTLVVQVFVLFGVSVFLYAKAHKMSTKNVLNEFRFKKISFKAVVLSILIGVVVYFLNSYIASFFYFLLSQFGFSISGSQVPTTYSFGLLILNLLFTAVLPAICEETAHRGMLLSQLKKKNIAYAIIISSLLFGLLHINIYQFFYASILGVLLAVLTLSTDSIYPAMIVHFMNNALNVYFIFAHVNNLFSAKAVSFIFEMMTMDSIFGVLFYALFFLFLLFSLYILYVELCKESAKRKLIKIQNGFGKFLARKIYFEELNHMRSNDISSKTEITIDVDSISEYIGEKETSNEKVSLTFYSKLFLFGSIFLSAITTIFTFIWGII